MCGYLTNLKLFAILISVFKWPKSNDIYDIGPTPQVKQVLYYVHPTIDPDLLPMMSLYCKNSPKLGKYTFKFPLFFFPCCWNKSEKAVASKTSASPHG